MQRVSPLPFIIVALTFLLILLGGLVHNTESSLACPDWPLCYGQFFPEMRGGILIEHSHRLLASLVGFVVFLGFSFSLSKKSPLNPFFRYYLLALILVIVQGIFGGITVIYKLPTIVSTTHLTLALCFFLFVMFLHHLHHRKEVFEVSQNSLEANFVQSLRRTLYVFFIILFAQVVFGAFIRHSGIGAACGVGAANSLLCFDVASNQMSLIPSTTQAITHFLHRLLGFALAIGSLLFVRLYFQFKKIAKLDKGWSSISKILLLIPLVTFLQALLGILTIVTVIGPITTTLHLGGATLLLALVWKAILLLRDYLNQADQNFLKPGHLEELLELMKPKLSLLVVATALIGMLATSKSLEFFHTLYILSALCFLVMGSAILNCYLEKDVDSKMERTRLRASVTGSIPSRHAMVIGLFFLIVSLVMLYTVNWSTMILGLTGSALYLLAYTPLKEKTEFAVYVGAIPGAIPILMGWTAVGEPISMLAISLFLILFVWQIPHFLAIAIIYSEQYQAAGLSVFPNTIGVKPTIKLSLLNCLLLLAVSLFPYLVGDSSKAYAYIASFLSLVFLGLTALSLNFENKEALLLKSKYVFWYSLLFLPLILIFMIFLK